MNSPLDTTTQSLRRCRLLDLCTCLSCARCHNQERIEQIVMNHMHHRSHLGSQVINMMRRFVSRAPASRIS